MTENIKICNLCFKEKEIVDKKRKDRYILNVDEALKSTCTLCDPKPSGETK